MELPEGWTDDMRVQMRTDRKEIDLVAIVMKALINREDLKHLIQTMHDEFGLSEEDTALALDRIQGGIVRAITGNPKNKPDKKKDPLAWYSFQKVWNELPKRHWFSSRKISGGQWYEWFEETRKSLNKASQQVD